MTFNAAISGALATIRSQCGRTVTLRRGVNTRDITATPARSVTEIETFQNARLHVQHRDYIVAAADYDFGDGSCEPLPGDEITDLDRTFVLTRLADQVPCWEWSDRGQSHYRIHCEETGRGA